MIVALFIIAWLTALGSLVALYRLARRNAREVETLQVGLLTRPPKRKSE